MDRTLISDLEIEPDWIDYNEHMSDVGYHRIFSRSEVAFLKRIEADKTYRDETGCSVHTVESHISFRHEVKAGDRVTVSFQILDLSNKAVHVMMTLTNAAGIVCAHHETMLLHVEKTEAGPKVGPFGRYQLANLVHLFAKDKTLPRPPRAGAVIAIRRAQAPGE